MDFERVYQEHFAFVWRTLRRLGVREADTADAAQEVFLVVHRKLPEFEGRSMLTTWLFGISLRVARDRLKRAHVRHETLDEEAVADHIDERGDVGAQAERRESLAHLERVLGRLDLDQRAAFTLFELEGLPCDQIAAMMEVPVATIHSRLRLAREAFRKAADHLDAREHHDLQASLRRQGASGRHDADARRDPPASAARHDAPASTGRLP